MKIFKKYIIFTIGFISLVAFFLWGNYDVQNCRSHNNCSAEGLFQGILATFISFPLMVIGFIVILIQRFQNRKAEANIARQNNGNRNLPVIIGGAIILALFPLLLPGPAFYVVMAFLRLIDFVRNIFVL